MQSFHRSRGRILFEVFCAFAVAESCVGAWKQTGAWALLPAAVVAALYGVVHAFDMIGKRATVAAVETVPAVHQETLVAAEPVEQPAVEDSIQVAEENEAPAPRPTRARRPKSAPKGARRRPTAREEKVAEPVMLDEVQATEVAPAEELKPVEIAPPETPKVAEATPPDGPNVTPFSRPDETPPAPLTPLFEPEPFVRQQRAVFGRKS